MFAVTIGDLDAIYEVESKNKHMDFSIFYYDMLTIAARGNRGEIVKYLLSKKNINNKFDDNYLLKKFTEYKNNEMIEYLKSF